MSSSALGGEMGATGLVWQGGDSAAKWGKLGEVAGAKRNVGQAFLSVHAAIALAILLDRQECLSHTLAAALRNYFAIPAMLCSATLSLNFRSIFTGGIASRLYLTIF